MKYHRCEFQGPYDVYQDETDIKYTGWLVECNKDFAIPIYFCPFCGVKLV